MNEWLTWRKTDHYTVAPDSPMTLEFLMGVQIGDIFLTKGKVARNPRQLKLFWALCDKVVENDETYANKTRYDVRNDIFEVLGFMEESIGRGGRIYRVPKSIAFESMPQAEFTSLFNRFLDIVYEWTAMQPEELRKEIYAMVDQGYSAMRRG